MNVALINTNRMQPPIAPIGLDYVAEALHAAGHHPHLLDLAWEEDSNRAIERFFDEREYGLIGVTLRNTDDCAFTSRQSFLGEFAETVKAIRRHTDAPVIVGGVGFSVMPEEILKACGADAGVWGEGEFAFPELADRVEKRQEWNDVGNLVWRRNGSWRRNRVLARSLAGLPPMSRTWVDNQRYFRHGGQAGFETKRGCPGSCVYCADPVAKGAWSRTRLPGDVANELERLLEQGLDHLHTCDGEFNQPAWHALGICKEMIRRRLGERMQWYAYCSPAPFSKELAEAMRAAGCVGINFGVDSGDEGMLRSLRRTFRPADIVEASRWTREAGMAVMLDLLLGGPGESKESLARTVEVMRQAEPDRVGVTVGVRVYPGTQLARVVESGEGNGGLVGGPGAAEPLFYLEPGIAPIVFEYLDRLIGDDPRFLFFDPARPEKNYNYNANERLIKAIEEGHRGAYWDILRRYESV